MIFENTPTLRTDRLVLRKYVEADVAALFDILGDSDVNVFLPWFPLKTRTETESFLYERFLVFYDKPSAYRYAVCLKEDDRPIGYVWLSDSESRDLGYALKKEFWGRGIASEASAAVVGRVRDAGYTYITTTHDIDNSASGCVMKKLGMKYRYSYVERWQPKDVSVTFRMYQLNFDGNDEPTYMDYWNRYKDHFIEQDV